MKEKIKKYIGGIFILIGSFITAYGVFSFSYGRDCGVRDYTISGSECSNPVAYFYSGEVRLLIGLGTILLIAGIFVIKNRKKRNSE